MGICVSCRRRDRKAPEKRWVPGTRPAKGAAAELLPRRWPLPAMANSISNIKMTNPIKGMVSKRRIRYMKDGFNLDLAYITDRLIAMGYPGDKLEGVYRNHIDDVYKFLEQMHKGHYKIYNLCAERTYDSNKFHGRVQRYELVDHAPPEITQIQQFCDDVHHWLNEDPKNVAAVHCKAGKGRTGTMVCCYLLYCGQKESADMALQFYGHKRTHDKKGVTIPSQRRYVDYYAALVRGGLEYRATRVHVRELLMSPPPALTGSQCTLEVTVTQPKILPEQTFKASLGSHELRRSEGGAGAATARVCAAVCTPLAGDVRVDVYCKPKMMMRKERLFHFWFNTFFVTACVGAEPVPAPDDSPNLETFKLTLDKWQLDDAHKDKQHKLYSPDFKVELIIQKQPESSTFSGHSARASSSLSSCASSGSEPDTEPDGNWDSGERIYRPCHRCPYLYNTDYDYPDSYTSKPDDFADLPEYTPNDDDKLYMNVNDNSNTNTQYDDFSLSKNINVPDNSNGDKLYTNASEHTIDTNPRYDNSKSKTPELDDYLRMKTQERLNESSKSDESSQSVNIDDELCSNKVLQHNDNEMCRTEIDKASGVHSKPLSDDIEASRDTNFPVNNESCTCKLERLDRKSSFASHLLDDDKKLYTNQFELPVNTGLDKPECDYNVYRSNGENTIKPCQNLSKPQYYSVNADSCINKSKHPIGNMHTCNTDSIKRDFFTDIQSDNTFTNKVDYQVNTIDQNDVKYSIDNELSDPEDTGSINKSLDYFKTNLCTDGDSVCTKPPEYLDGTNIYQAVTEYSIGIEKTPQYLNSTEKPPDYSVESKKIVKTEEFSKKDKKCKSVSKPRLSLGDVRASWREFSGKFGENRKKKHKDDRQ